MQCKKVLLMFLLCIGLTQLNFAQTTASESNHITPSASQELASQENDDWSLYSDEENHIYYIDFEHLKVNLSDIIVKNESGRVLFKDDVFDLPVNTIYEIDFSKYKTGDYQIELRSFTGVIRKRVSIK